MIEKNIRQLEAKIDALVNHFGLEWKLCPQNFASFSPEEIENHSHGFDYCDEGEKKWGDCNTCKGAGLILIGKES